MSNFQDQIINEALSWQGTKWQHHQSLKGVGTDCVGFLKGVAMTVNVDITPIEKNYTRQTHINVDEFDLIGFEINLDDLQPADLLFFRVGFKCPIRHCGIYLGDSEFIHACQRVGRVIKHPLSHPYDRLLARAYRVYTAS